MILKSRPRIGLSFILLLAIQVFLTVILEFSGLDVPYLGREVANSLAQNSMPFPKLFISIFSNNLEIASLVCIPVIGLLFYFFFTIQTALAASSYIVELHASPYVLLNLFSHPDTLIEMSAYSMSAVISLYLLFRVIISKPRSMSKLLNSIYLYALMALILVTAAILETADIKCPIYWGGYFDAYWLPAILATITIIVTFQKIIRIRLSVSTTTH